MWHSYCTLFYIQSFFVNLVINFWEFQVPSFVFIMALEDEHYLGCLEDTYEDKKWQKKVGVSPQSGSEEGNPSAKSTPQGSFHSPNVQVISAEGIDGPETVLTPNRYEKFMCYPLDSSVESICALIRQFKNHKLRLFSLGKLQGYFNQAYSLFLR